MSSRRVKWYIIWPWRVNLDSWPQFKAMASLLVSFSTSTENTELVNNQNCTILSRKYRIEKGKLKISTRHKLSSDKISNPKYQAQIIAVAKYRMNKDLSICEISHRKNINNKLSASKKSKGDSRKTRHWRITDLMRDDNLSVQFIQRTRKSSQIYLTSN